MKLNKFKYYLVIFMLIAVMLVGFVFGGGIQDKNATNLGTDIEEEEIVTAPTTPEETQTETIPTFNNAFSLWNYSYNIYKTGNGFKYTQFTNATTPIGTQSIYSFVQVNGPMVNNTDSIEVTFREGSSSLFNNKAFVSYIDKEGTFHVFETSKNIFKQELTIDGQFDSNSFDEIFVKRGRNSVDIPVTISNKTSKLVYFNKSNKNYYEFKVEINEKGFSDTYYKGVTDDPMIDSIPKEFVKISATVKISKTTGYLLSLKLEEEFKVKPAGIFEVAGLLTCTNTSTFTYREMNKSQEVLDPRPASKLYYDETSKSLSLGD